jgi:hypothetical protein
MQPFPQVDGRKPGETFIFKGNQKASPTGGDLEGAKWLRSFMITALHNLQIISDGQIAAGKAVLITGDRITAIVDEIAIPDQTEKIDLDGAFLRRASSTCKFMAQATKCLAVFLTLRL